MRKSNIDRFAGIEYAGVPGCTEDCIRAVVRKLHYGEHISRVSILSCERSHCLLLKDDIGDVTAVKSGFASGYGGEGPRGLCYVLRLLETYGAEIDEFDVNEEIIQRVDRACLRSSDIRKIEEARPIRPQRWYDYIFDDYRLERNEDGRLWQKFPLVLPFGILDSRIADLAMQFAQHPDAALLSAYRRLEDIVRQRTEIDAIGAKLFSSAFQGESSKLCWGDIHVTEQTGRANLFVGAYMAFRNPRAHREPNSDRASQLSEFLLLNQLYVLERQSQLRLCEEQTTD